MSKLFTVGGISNARGKGYKVRFANDLMRIKVLSKLDTDVNLMELPTGMTKAEVVTFLKTTNLYQNVEYKMTIDAADAKYNGAAIVKVKGSKITKKPSLAAIKARAVTTTEAE